MLKLFVDMFEFYISVVRKTTWLGFGKNMSLLKIAGLVGWKMSTRLVKYIRLSAGRFTDILLKISGLDS